MAFRMTVGALSWLVTWIEVDSRLLGQGAVAYNSLP